MFTEGAASRPVDGTGIARKGPTVSCNSSMRASARRLALVVAAAIVTACATVPGSDYPKEASTALAQPERTPLGREVAALTRTREGTSGFRLLAQGVESFL